MSYHIVECGHHYFCLSEDKWISEKVFRIHPFQSGVYLLYDLHKNPHYHLPTNMRNCYNKKADQKGIKVIDVNTDSYICPDQLYHFSNESTTFKKMFILILLN